MMTMALLLLPLSVKDLFLTLFLEKLLRMVLTTALYVILATVLI
jgi:hypothetical protein